MGAVEAVEVALEAEAPVAVALEAAALAVVVPVAAALVAADLVVVDLVVGAVPPLGGVLEVVVVVVVAAAAAALGVPVEAVARADQVALLHRIEVLMERLVESSDRQRVPSGFLACLWQLLLQRHS